MKPLQFSNTLLTPGCMGAPLKFILATTAAMWMGSATAAWSPPPVRQGQELRFRDFFTTHSGDDGLPAISDKLRQAAGKTVRLTGYMCDGGIGPESGFLLSSRPRLPVPSPSERYTAPAWVWVELDAAHTHQAVPQVGGLVEVTGLLDVGCRTSPSGLIAWATLHVPPETPLPHSADAMAGYVHTRPKPTV